MHECAIYVVKKFNSINEDENTHIFVEWSDHNVTEVLVGIQNLIFGFIRSYLTEFPFKIWKIWNTGTEKKDVFHVSSNWKKKLKKLIFWFASLQFCCISFLAFWFNCFHHFFCFSVISGNLQSNYDENYSRVGCFRFRFENESFFNQSPLSYSSSCKMALILYAQIFKTRALNNDK